jgi:hypothetical protein
LFNKYSRLPFDSVVFENSKIAVLARKSSKDEKLVSLTVISPVGAVIHYNFFIIYDRDQFFSEPGLVGNIEFARVLKRNDLHEQVEMELLKDEGYAEEIRTLMTVMCYKVLDILLHFNVANVRIHKYTPTQKEMKHIPGRVQEKYVYHILDVFRERTIYHSLKDVEDRASDTVGGVQRKAHLVRGHFKEKKNGLFWWNPFMRNSKNRESVGYVDKDYQLH